MRKLLLLMTALLTLGVSGAWAMDFTWTSGVNFLTQTSTGNASFGWFSIVSPFNGNITSLKLNLGTGSGNGISRTDAYLGISSDLKQSSTGFSASDFVAISTNTCGTSDYEVTMTFNNAELAGGMMYFCYFLTENNGTYTTVGQRYYVVTGQTKGKMSIGNIGSKDVVQDVWAVPVSCTLSIKDGSFYRMKGIVPSDEVDCWIYSNPENDNKLWKIKVADKSKPSVTEDRYVWKTVIDGGIKIQNVGSSRYIPAFTASSANGSTVNYLSAVSSEDAVSLTPNDRVAKGKMGYVSLQTTYQSANTWLNTFTNQNTYVGCHNSVHVGDVFLFQQVKKVTFSQAVAVNSGDDVSTIYLAADGSDSFTLPSAYLYSTDGGTTNMTNTEAATALAAAGTSNITVTVSANPTRNVSYTLLWSDGTEISTVDDVTVNLSASASEFVPSAFVNDFATLSYSPEIISSETTVVTVTATWNGPFLLSESYNDAKWYTVGIHTAHEGNNNIWKNENNALRVGSIGTASYQSLTDAQLFCFVGNPYTGLSIYNKGQKKVTKVDDKETEATIGDDGSLFIPVASNEEGKSIANGYACFKLKDSDIRLNWYDTGWGVFGWDDSGNGSTCWFIPAGQYYLNFIDGLGIDAPVGVVGTSSYFSTVADVNTCKNTLRSLRSTIAGALYSDVTTLSSVNGQLNPIRNAGIITLNNNGFYRVVSAVSGFNLSAAWYYNPSVDETHIIWAREATTTAHQINSIFQFTESSNKWNIYSPNAQKYITVGNGTWNSQNAALGDAAPLTLNSIGSAQYTFLQSNNAQTIHAKGHDNGTGTNGTLVTWDANELGAASAWYIVPVDNITLSLNEAGDGYYYATACLPFDLSLSEACAYTLELNARKTGLTASDAMTNVPAGTPVILKSGNSSVTATISSSTATNAPLVTTALRGTYTDLAVTAETDYFLGVDENKVGFYKWLGTTLKANRAYLPASVLVSGVKGFTIDFNDETAIEEVNESETSQGRVYNLAGQRVSKPTQGLYIVNGKKVIIK